MECALTIRAYVVEQEEVAGEEPQEEDEEEEGRGDVVVEDVGDEVEVEEKGESEMEESQCYVRRGIRRSEKSFDSWKTRTRSGSTLVRKRQRGDQVQPTAKRQKRTHKVGSANRQSRGNYLANNNCNDKDKEKSYILLFTPYSKSM